jgi:hypothetical protein
MKTPVFQDKWMSKLASPTTSGFKLSTNREKTLGDIACPRASLIPDKPSDVRARVKIRNFHTLFLSVN